MTPSAAQADCMSNTTKHVAYFVAGERIELTMRSRCHDLKLTARAVLYFDDLLAFTDPAWLLACFWARLAAQLHEAHWNARFQWATLGALNNMDIPAQVVRHP